MIQRPSPLNFVLYSQLPQLLTGPLYIGLQADGTRLMERRIQAITQSPYYHVGFVGQSPAGLMFAESTLPKADVVPFGPRVQRLSGRIDIFRLIPEIDERAVWRWACQCSGEWYGVQDLIEVYLDRYRGHYVPVVPNSDIPRGCDRDCSCQVHAALRVHGFPLLWPTELPYDAVIAPSDLCEQTKPQCFRYICSPTFH